MPDPLSWSIVVLLVIFSAFFSGTETAFACVNQFRLRVKADNGSKVAKLVVKIYEKYDEALITSLIGYNIVSIGISIISTFLFIKIFFGIFDDTIASLLATIVMTVVVYLFGDTIPKLVAKNRPNQVAMATGYVFYFFMLLFYPITKVFNGITWLMKKVFKVKEKPTMTEEDFTNVVESIEEEGILEDKESDIIQASLDFSDTTVKEVLTPANKMYSINISNLTHEALNDIILKTTYSRIPVYKDSKDNIIGVLHVKSYLRDYLKNKNVNIEKCLQKPYFVTPSIILEDMMEGYKKHHTHIAIVKSDNKLIGMITMEDVLEELVGNIGEKDPSSFTKGGQK
jgi:putative hemolysin